jgi:hypothetical protein
LFENKNIPINRNSLTKTLINTNLPRKLTFEIYYELLSRLEKSEIFKVGIAVNNFEYILIHRRKNNTTFDTTLLAETGELVDNFESNFRGAVSLGNITQKGIINFMRVYSSNGRIIYEFDRNKKIKNFKTVRVAR